MDRKHKNSFVWQEKKYLTMSLSKSYTRLKMQSKASRVYQCGTFLEFWESIETGESRLHSANFCKIRLCPLCAWRRSLKIFGQTSQIMDNMPNGSKFIFLTLTVRNPCAEELIGVISQMFKAFKRFMERKKIKRSFLGWFRALEITYNRKENTYHPHFHVILVCSSYYFHNNYISVDEFKNIWKESLRIEYDPVVFVQKFTDNDKKGVAEASKYTVKQSDYFTKKGAAIDHVVSVLDAALCNRRLVAYGGIMKEIRNKLKLDDCIDGDLVGATDMREDVAHIVKRYAWHVGYSNYFAVD